MTETNRKQIPVTVGELLDAAKNGDEFHAAINSLFRALEQAMGEEN